MPTTRGNLALVPDDDDSENAYALKFGLYVLSLLNSIEYGHLEIHKHARDLHKFRRVEDFKAPDALKRSQMARRRELST